MDRYILITDTMDSVCNLVLVASVVVGVAILGSLALLRTRALHWRWAPSGLTANSRSRKRLHQV